MVILAVLCSNIKKRIIGGFTYAIYRKLEAVGVFDCLI
ncbi:hypothetical protein K661_00912 [Piscirickettsia salmonis LF-89 = ATCC VR-1361]|nr:hypothetical protein K661_00912 [Piscirickettsia salmonis LF-89 = ATCC VR-1361]